VKFVVIKCENSIDFDSEFNDTSVPRNSSVDETLVNVAFVIYDDTAYVLQNTNKNDKKQTVKQSPNSPDKVFVAFGKHEMSTAAQVFRHVNLLAKFQHPS